MKIKTDNKIPRPSPQRPFPFPNSGSQGSIKPGGPHIGKTPLPKQPDLGQIKPGGPDWGKPQLPKPPELGEIKPGGPDWGKPQLPKPPDLGEIKPGGPFITDQKLPQTSPPDHFFSRPTDKSTISPEAGKPDAKLSPALLNGLSTNFQ